MEPETQQTQDGEVEVVNDCTGVLKLAGENVKVYSSTFTYKSLAGLDVDDKAMIAMLISYCTTNFSLQHHVVRAYLSTHRMTQLGEVQIIYVISIKTPLACRFKYSKLTEMKELRMVRIADVEVGYCEAPGEKLCSQVTLTVHSMLNKLDIESISVTRININRAVDHRSYSEDLTNERGIVKRPRRS